MPKLLNSELTQSILVLETFSDVLATLSKPPIVIDSKNKEKGNE